MYLYQPGVVRPGNTSSILLESFGCSGDKIDALESAEVAAARIDLGFIVGSCHSS